MSKVKDIIEKYNNRIPSLSYGDFSVIRYNNCLDIEIEFIDTGYRYSINSSNLLKRSVYDPFAKVVFGKGFMGKGPYKAHISGTNKKHQSYINWTMMLARCYDESHHRYNSYEKCIVCDEWLNYQNFAKWYDINHYEGQDIDKDILNYGRDEKLYGPNTCIFIPKHLNRSLGKYFGTENKSVQYHSKCGYYYFRVQYKDYITGETHKEYHRGFQTRSEAEKHYWIITTDRIMGVLDIMINNGEINFDKYHLVKSVITEHLSNKLKR